MQILPCVRLSSEEADALCTASDVTCDPYEHISWAISASLHPGESDETDIICFDHACLTDGRVVLMSVLDSASGHYVDTFDCFVCRASSAMETAQAMIDDAYDWFRSWYEPEDLESNTQEWLTALHKDLYPHHP